MGYLTPIAWIKYLGEKPKVFKTILGKLLPELKAMRLKGVYLTCYIDKQEKYVRIYGSVDNEVPKKLYKIGCQTNFMRSSRWIARTCNNYYYGKGSSGTTLENYTIDFSTKQKKIATAKHKSDLIKSAKQKREQEAIERQQERDALLHARWKQLKTLADKYSVYLGYNFEVSTKNLNDLEERVNQAIAINEKQKAEERKWAIINEREDMPFLEQINRKMTYYGDKIHDKNYLEHLDSVLRDVRNDYLSSLGFHPYKDDDKYKMDCIIRRIKAKLLSAV